MDRSVQATRPFSLLIKPAGADCNLNCDYCFYAVKKCLYPETAAHRMSAEVLERMIASFMATSQLSYTFGWQGGEPTLMGTDFFKQVTDLQQKHGKPGSTVANGLQTNGTLITDDMSRHFGQYHFLLGVSLDGPPELHDVYRLSHDGRPSHARVMEGIERLTRERVEFNILVLVNAANVKHARKVYTYLRDKGFYYHQYIPCVEFDKDGRPLPFAITGRQWGDFLCGIFDEWIKSDTRLVSVRHFDSVLGRLVGEPSTVCHMERDCRQYFVVEHNGDVYPCDFFVRPELKLGNVMTNTWEEMQASDIYARFGVQKAKWNACCSKCRYLPLCAGDCLKNRPDDVRAPEALSHLCAGWRRFYDHTLSRFRALADGILQERRMAALDRARIA